jgi:hypothetical protein
MSRRYLVPQLDNNIIGRLTSLKLLVVILFMTYSNRVTLIPTNSFQLNRYILSWVKFSAPDAMGSSLNEKYFRLKLIYAELIYLNKIQFSISTFQYFCKWPWPSSTRNGIIHGFQDYFENILENQDWILKILMGCSAVYEIFKYQVQMKEMANWLYNKRWRYSLILDIKGRIHQACLD